MLYISKDAWNKERGLVTLAYMVNLAFESVL